MLMQKKPTDSELEILQLLWQHGSCSVRDVHTALSERRPVVYTTTLKTMQIIEHHHTARIHSPMVVGVVKQVILLPLGLVNSIEPEQLEGILAHELAHIKRHDYLFNLLQSQGQSDEYIRQLEKTQAAQRALAKAGSHEKRRPADARAAATFF